MRGRGFDWPSSRSTWKTLPMRKPYCFRVWRTGDRRYHTALALVYLAWSDAERRQKAPDLGRRLARLEKALQHDPSNSAVMSRFSELLATSSPTDHRFANSIRDRIARGQATAGMHFVLGADAWRRGQTSEARLHLEQACRIDPGMAVATNNLAWVIASSDPVDLPRTCDLIDRFVAAWPNVATYRGTRGHIRTRMGRWKDALSDLETALTATPDNPDLHRDLAETYEKLGDREMAARHRQQPNGKEHQK